MNELTDEIVNKGLAKLMGEDWDEEEGLPYIWIEHDGEKVKAYHSLYTESLDALVPVWNKMREEMKTEMLGTFKLFDYNGKPWNFSFETDYNPLTDICVEYESDNPQQAASYATYKTAKKLGLI